MNAKCMSLLYFSSLLTLELVAIGLEARELSSFEELDFELLVEKVEKLDADEDFLKCSKTAIVLDSI